MAFDPNNPPSLIASGIGGSRGLKAWAWKGSDPIATVIGAGYIRTARKLGMGIGDAIRYVDGSDDPHHLVLSAIDADTGWGTLVFPETAPEAYPVDATPSGVMYVVAYIDGVQSRVDPTLLPAGVLTFASQAEAEAGSATDKPLNALRTKQAIDAQRPYASQAEAEAGVNNTKDMTPLRVRQAISVTPLITDGDKGDITVGGAGTTLTLDAIVARAKLTSAFSSAIELSVKEHGAVGDSVTNDRAAFLAADAVGPFVVPAGGYLISSNMTITNPIDFRPGGRLVVPTGVTVTLNGGIIADHRFMIFQCTGTGNVVINKARTSVGYPEWWGAVADGSTDCLAAINACIVACPVTQLGYGTYRTTGTILMQTAHRTLRGVGKAWTTSAVGSIIAIESASLTGILQGLNANPGTINGHLQHTTIENLTVSRSVTINSTSTAIGVATQWVLFAVIKNVEAIQNKIGFNGAGCVQAHYDKCYAFRHAVGTVPASDSTYGYFLNGASGLAAAGGNASVYYDDCTAACALNAAQSPTNVGFGFAGPAADTFLRRGEVTSCIQGIVVSGGGTQAGDADIHIQDCVCDAIQSQGVVFSALGSYAAIKHTGNYYAPASGATFTGITVSNCIGMIHSDGNQVIGWPGTSTGLSIGTAGRINSNDMFNDCVAPVVMSAATYCQINGHIRNPAVLTTQAVLVTGSGNRNYIAPVITGAAGAFTYGINIDATGTYNEVNATTINPTAATNKVRINGVNYTVPGTYSTNLLSGIAA